MKTLKKIKAIPLIAFFILFTFSSVAQPFIGLGLKGGANFSKLSFYVDDYNSEAITKSHWGAFGRIGYNRVFLQPEAYFSAKGGTFSSNAFLAVTKFDYTTVDVPILLGFKLVEGNQLNLHLLAGPTFNVLTSKRISGDELLSPLYYNDRYLGFQYGVGVDIWFLTLGARMEHGKDNIYSHPSLQGKSQTFMLSVGIKIF